MFSSLRPFCDGPSPRWSQPFARSFDRRVFPSPCVSLRLIPPSSPVISRYHPLSHVISPNRIQSHRIALLSWQKDLTLQHEHDSWVGPPPDWPRQTSRLPCRIHVSTVFDILTHKGRAQPVTGQAPPQTQSEERNPPMPPRAGSRAPGEPPRRRRSVAS